MAKKTPNTSPILARIEALRAELVGEGESHADVEPGSNPLIHIVRLVFCPIDQPQEDP